MLVLGKPCAHLVRDGFNFLAAEMEQNAMSRCLQLLIFISQSQEQIIHSGRRFKSEFGRTSVMVPRRGGEDGFPASFASSPAALAVRSLPSCFLGAIHR